MRTFALRLCLLLIALFGLSVHEIIQAAAGYTLVETFSDVWDVSAPCYNSGSCNFSCSASTVGRTCYANTCTGTGNGETAFLVHKEYECVQTCSANAGQSCSSAPNSCGMTGTGTYSCDGTCSAVTPSENSCPAACVPNAGQSCSSAPNSCGMTGSGTYSCDGSCSATVPSDNSCPAACVPNAGQSCSSGPNACGMTGSGTYSCDGTCSATVPSNNSCPAACVPNAGQSCSSSPNSCGMTGTGTYSCNGTCSAVTPSDNSCPAACVPYAGQSCSSSPNSCGMTGTGAYSCDGTCSATVPSNESCTPDPGNGGEGGSCVGASVDISASPTRVRRNASTQLTISASGVNTSCVISGPGISQAYTPSSCNVSRTIVTPPITAQSIYTVSCDSGVVADQVIVNLFPWYRLF